ncbi:fumarylacetoacetate hydrolase family protein [Acuticoccus mangrovi]|uniref:Fumarylacetoacetate hydrolase family protein n=1 Tax=Acuticoccus mangrovi TaxID=2796142 RepID=A0A934IF33_9HYPH|nr:fumarylacetoacetate hydrolase family protein [Acuticoccus mangrovi]MBJ3775459.1 fumarylacetoacetate hydrolase family protein [Acuticoccus mangrovi]
MQFISFVRRGECGFGALVDGGVVNLTGRLAPGVDTLKAAIAADLLGAAADYVAGRKAEHALAELTLLPVIPDPAKILCVGVNYEMHREETKRAKVAHPTLFTRFADTLVAHGDVMVKPAASDCLDFEGELAVIIGRGGRNIAEADAMDHVAGYAPFNDGSVRDFQRHTSQFVPGKNFPRTGAFGPALVTPDEIGDVSALPISTVLNGEVVQQASLSDLIFSIPRVISYITSFTTLQPGDVIATGTPGGVGERRDPPLWMKCGDVVEVRIGKAGTLVNRIVAE